MKYLLMTIIVMFSSIVNAEDTSIDSDSILVTVILKHQQDKSLT